MASPTLHIHEPRADGDQSPSDRAYHAIRELIVTLGLPPGSVVSEPALMEQLGLGRTPVREALRDLARERLVEVYPRRGMFVSGVDVGDIAGLSEVRLVSSAGCAARGRATERRRPRRRGRGELGSERARDRETGVRGRVERPSGELIALDQRLHRHVYRCTHNPFLAATLEEYYVLTLRIWFLALDRVARLDDAVREHRELLEAIRDRDGDGAEAVMRAHVKGFEQAIRACSDVCIAPAPSHRLIYQFMESPHE